jgi:hypothetical protein
MSWLSAHLPAHLVPLTDLVHAIREGAEGREEDGSGAGARGGNPARVAHGRETARRRPVLQHRHLLDAGHPRLVPHQGLRHPRSLPGRRTAAGIKRALLPLGLMEGGGGRLCCELGGDRLSPT